MRAQPAAGGGRWVQVPPERLARWLEGFHGRHDVRRTVAGPGGPAGPSGVAGSAGVVRFEAADSSLAECHPPFGPAVEPGEWPEFRPAPLLAQAARELRVGVLLARLGGYGAGVFDGGRLLASKVDSRLVHARHKKGGSSQARFARRHDGEVRQVVDAAAGVAVRVLLPSVASLEALVLGGDRRLVDLVLADRRLAPLPALVTEQFLTVADPRQAVLEATPSMFRAVRIRLT